MLKDVCATRYRSLVARANYLATGRPDLAISVTELCTPMSETTESSWSKFVRVVKYIRKNLRLILKLDYQDPVGELDVYSDANWAGCRSTRKSTSGGVVRRGQHLIKAWSRNQNIIALNSAESEFLATVKASMSPRHGCHGRSIWGLISGQTQC